MNPPRKNLVYFLLFGNPQRVKWFPDDYLDQLRLSVSSLRRTSDPAGFDVLFLADREKAEALRALPELEGLPHAIRSFDVPADLRSAMSMRFLVHTLMGEAMGRYDKVLYADIDIVFVRDVQRVFEQVTDPELVYVKPERLGGTGVQSKLYSVGDHTEEEARRFAEERVRVVNSGQFAFVNGPRMDALFADLRAALPALVSRSAFVDQAPFNSFLRSRHLVAPCLDQRVLDERVRLETDYESPRTAETALVHFIKGDKVARMRAELGAHAPAPLPAAAAAARAHAAVRELLGRATAHHQKGQLAEAEAYYRDGLSDQPQNSRERSLFGFLLFQTKRHEEAVTVLDRSLAVNGAQADAHAWRGLALQQLGRTAEAAGSYAAAVRVDPRHAGARNNLGVSLVSLRRPDEALVHLRRAAELGHRPPELFVMMGRAHKVLGQAAEAEQAYRQALAIHAGFADARVGLADVLHDRGDFDGAIAELRRVIEANPKLLGARSSLVMKLRDRGEVAPEMVAAELRAAGQAYAGTFGPGDPSWRVRDRDPDRRLRVGYLSPCFHEHASTPFLEALLAAHDPAAVEVHGYSSTDQRDATTERLRGLSHGWRDVAGRTPHEIAALVAADEMDILVDCAGHTSTSQIGLLALKPAPIQVTWLGTGLSTVDYRFTDAITDPPGKAESHPAEELIRLPAEDHAMAAGLQRALLGRAEALSPPEGPRFARDVEAAYRTMWRRRCGRGEGA